MQHIFSTQHAKQLAQNFYVIVFKYTKIYLSEKTNNISKEKPGTITDINKNGIVVSTKDYDIILKNIKLEGKNRCDVKDFINGIKKENFIGGIFNE